MDTDPDTKCEKNNDSKKDYKASKIINKQLIKIYDVIN